jgi:8-oxo-dGTP pyrophosphatase MutT (NUDIX family)
VQELGEELSVVPDSVRVATPYEVDDRKIDRVWVVYPVLATLKQKPNITLDWEHTDFAWIKPEQLKDYDYVKDFDISIARALALNTE